MAQFEEEFYKKLIPNIEVEQGGIYTVADKPDNPIVKFPEDNLPNKHPRKNRNFHKQRYVLVIQRNSFNEDYQNVSTQIIPLSHKGHDSPTMFNIP